MGLAQLLIELHQSRLLESDPLCDACLYLLACFLVNRDRLRRYGTIPTFDNSQSGCQTGVSILQSGALVCRVFLVR